MVYIYEKPTLQDLCVETPLGHFIGTMMFAPFIKTIVSCIRRSVYCIKMNACINRMHP
jgi:hypothetical protein